MPKNVKIPIGEPPTGDPPTNGQHGVDPADWVDQYGDALLAFALGRVRKREVAEDLVQDTLLAAWVNRERFDGRAKFATWLVSILRRKIADHYRRDARTLTASSLEENAPDPFTPKGMWRRAPWKWKADPAQLAEEAEFQRVATSCIEELPPHFRQAFQLRDLGDASPKEISVILNISPENLAVRLHRARVLLRQCLESKYFGLAARTASPHRGSS